MKPVGTDPTLPVAADTEPSVPFTRPEAEVEGYDLGEVIGRGGMGEVVVAHDRNVGRDVALKRMHDPAGRPEASARFLREARIQARLDHPAIVPVHEVGTDSANHPYFTMKRVTGTTLAALVERQTERPQRLLRAFVDVCLAIELAHSRQVVHRDLKPANIMLGDYGEVYVLDWGVARLLTDTLPDTPSTEPVASSQITQAGSILGTPGYIAPEQLDGTPVTAASDVYSLGAILFEILTGERLHPQGRLVTTTPESPAHRAPGRAIAPELDAACLAALAFDPAQRPTARALGERVQAYLDGDRDLERRRGLAAEQLAAAKAALAAGRRDEAMRTAGRALALDPESVDAAELVTSLIVEPPRELPPELLTSLAEEENEFIRVRSRRSIIAYLAIFMLVPFLPLVHIASWPLAIAVFAGAAALAGIQWINSRNLRVPPAAVMAANLAYVVLFSRIAGALMLTPMLICAVLLAIGSRDPIARRPVVVVGWAVLATLGPIVLEQLGVLAPTTTITSAGVVSSGTIIDSRTATDLVGIVGGNVAFAILVGLYASMITLGRADAQRRVHVQAWHLRHLLPRRASQRLIAG